MRDKALLIKDKLLLIIALLLINFSIITSTIVTDTTTIITTDTTAVTTDVTTTVDSIKVTYITFEVYGSEIVTNYIPMQDLVDIGDGYYTPSSFSYAYADATLTDEVGYVCTYGWLWGVEYVSTDVVTTTTSTASIECISEVTTECVEVSAVLVDTIIPEEQDIDGSVSFHITTTTLRPTMMITAYVGIVLVPTRLARDREYCTPAEIEEH